MKKKYCVQYKLGKYDWQCKWFDTKEERELFIDELESIDNFKTQKYITYLDDFGDVIKVERNK